MLEAYIAEVGFGPAGDEYEEFYSVADINKQVTLRSSRNTM